MGKIVKPHKCALPGCNVVTRNKLYCCREHASEGSRSSTHKGMMKCLCCGELRPAADFYVKRDKNFRKTCVDCRERADYRKNVAFRKSEAVREPIAVSHDKPKPYLDLPYEACGLWVDIHPELLKNVFAAW